MLIRVRELELRNLEFDENYQPGAIDFGPDFRQIGPLHSAGRAELIVEHRGHHQNVEDIRLVGKVEARLEFSCARCLEPVGGGSEPGLRPDLPAARGGSPGR